MYKLKVDSNNISKKQKVVDDAAVIMKWSEMRLSLHNSVSVQSNALRVDQMSLASMVTTFGKNVLVAAIDHIKQSIQAFDDLQAAGRNYISEEQQEARRQEETLRQLVDRFNANSILCLRETAIKFIQ